MSPSSNPSGPQFRADRPAEQEAVRTTIVGGRPPGSGKPLGDIPRGIDVLVKKASVDPEFRALLREDHAKAAELIGLWLDPAEKAILAAVPREQLEAIIERTFVPEEHRRVFLGKVAAAMLVAISGGGVAAAGGLAAGGFGSGGIMPDRPVPAPTGIRPDSPDAPPEPPPREAAMDTFSRTVAVLVRHTSVPEDEIIAEKLLVTQLGIDAAKAEKVCDALEAEFRVSLSRRAFGQLRRVGDLAERIEAVAAVQILAIDTIAKQLQVDAARLTGSTTLEKDLAVSRLQLAGLRRRLATQFRMHLDWDEFKAFQTVGDVVDYVACQVRKRDADSAEKKPELPVSRGIRPDRPMTFGIQPDR